MPARIALPTQPSGPAPALDCQGGGAAPRTQRSCSMKRVVVPACALALALLTLCTAEAQDRKKPVLKPAEVAKFKKIMKKLDPEISAAQKALQVAKKRLQKALNDEVLKEK